MISAGGTGGGMYPAFAVAQALARTADAESIELIFVGGSGGLDATLLRQSGIGWAHSTLILGGPVHGVSPLRLVWSLLKLTAGFVQALGLMLRLRPNRLFVTGGWASLPIALAAWLFRVPQVCFVPDIEPGWTLKLVSRFARKVAATTDESARFFRPGRLVATGYPLRESVLSADRDEALRHFDLDPARRTLLVFGGSRGARSLNRALLDILPDLVADDAWQVLHVTGSVDWPMVEAARRELPSDARARYHAFDYLHDDMGLALAAADLVISRAGASTLGEFTLFGLPAILVPYPFAWRYQKVNADYLVSRGAALQLADERLTADLLPTIRSLQADRDTLQQMAERSRALGTPDGAQNIARLLIKLEAR